MDRTTPRTLARFRRALEAALRSIIALALAAALAGPARAQDAGSPEPVAPTTPAAAEACPPPTPDDPDGGTPVEAEPDDDDGEGHAEDEDGKDEDEASAEAGPDLETESPDAAAPEGPGGPRYTADLSDAELARRWKEDLASLGSMSVGFVHAGRLINGVPFPKDGNWTVVSPEASYGTRETVEQIAAAIREVTTRFPDAPPLRVNHLSRKDGGYLRPHKSHQSGRDIDLAFYYPTADPVRVKHRDKCINVGLNWALVRALVTNTDVQVILVDQRIKKVIHDYAVSIGEDRAWLDSIFNAGKDSIVQHAKRHRDHFHVRFFAPRAQELGRRVQPLLAQRPEHNILSHRIRSGDTLGTIARRYGSTIQLIMRANGMRKSFLRAGRMLSVPLRGPCTKCPLPPEVVVPARRLPPEVTAKNEPVDGAQPEASGAN